VSDYFSNIVTVPKESRGTGGGAAIYECKKRVWRHNILNRVYTSLANVVQFDLAGKNPTNVSTVLSGLVPEGRIDFSFL